MEEIPEWMTKYPCTGCGDGYIQCAQGLSLNLKCCCQCDHPERWTTYPPYTKAELLDMWGGRQIPEYVQDLIDKLQAVSNGVDATSN